MNERSARARNDHVKVDSSGSGKWDEVVAPRLAVGYLIVAVGTWRRISWRIPLGMLVTLSGWLRGLLLS